MNKNNDGNGGIPCTGKSCHQLRYRRILLSSKDVILRACHPVALIPAKVTHQFHDSDTDSQIQDLAVEHRTNQMAFRRTQNKISFRFGNYSLCGICGCL